MNMIKSKDKKEIIKSIFLIICIVLIGISYVNIKNAIAEYNKIIDKTQAELNETKMQLNNMNDQMYTLLVTFANEDGTVPTVEEAIVDSNQMHSDLNKFKSRAELYDKYEYALMYNGKRTDITYDLVSYGETIMKDKNINPNLLFGLVMVESRGVEKAQNSSSSARGFCQLISSTAESLYEDVLHKGTYSHTYAFDGYTNLLLGSTLISRNMEKYNGDTYKVLQRYRGLSNIDSYYSAVDSFISRGGTSLRQISSEYTT